MSRELEVTLILFMWFRALLFKILIKEKKWGGFYIHSYINNGLQTCKVKDKNLGISKIELFLSKVKA